MGLGPSSTAWAPSTEPIPCSLTVIRRPLRRLLKFRSRLFKPLLLLGSVGDVDLDRVRHEIRNFPRFIHDLGIVPAGRKSGADVGGSGVGRVSERSRQAQAPAITSRPSTLAASQRGTLRVLAGFSEGVISDLAIWPFPGLLTRAVTAEGSGSGSSSGPWTTIGAPAMDCGSRRLDQSQLQGTH